MPNGVGLLYECQCSVCVVSVMSVLSVIGVRLFRVCERWECDFIVMWQNVHDVVYLGKTTWNHSIDYG